MFGWVPGHGSDVNSGIGNRIKSELPLELRMESHQVAGIVSLPREARRRRNAGVDNGLVEGGQHLGSHSVLLVHDYPFNNNDHGMS